MLVTLRTILCNARGKTVSLDPAITAISPVTLDNAVTPDHGPRPGRAQHVAASGDLTRRSETGRDDGNTEITVTLTHPSQDHQDPISVSG